MKFKKFKKLSHVLIFCLGIMLMFFAIDEILDFLENRFFSDVKTANPYLFMAINRTIGAFIGIFILKKLGKISILKSKGKGFWHGVLMGSITLIYPIFWVLGDMVRAEDINLQPLSVIAAAVFIFIMVGIVEEIEHRGILLNVIGDYFGYKNAGSVWKTVILSGFLFGVFHFSNILDGRSFLSVLGQVIQCTGLGIIYSAAYMRSRNLYSLMFLHAVRDIFVMSELFTVDANIVGIMSPQNVDFIQLIVILVIDILLAMFLLRKKKMQEIIDCDSSKSSLKIKV